MTPSASSPSSQGRALIRAIRPHHWIKNVVVVAAPLFGLALTVDTLLTVAWAFVAFCLTASAFYLVNDVRDRDRDRNHPVKKNRPIAAGELPVSTALAAAVVFLGVGIGGSYWVEPLLAATLGGYVLLQGGYNLGLKQQPIIDVMVLAGGFVLRAVAGGAAARIPLSEWFLLCVGFLAVFLGVEKRKAELAGETSPGTRAVMGFYTTEGLQRMEGVVTASALVTYALWTIEGAQTPWMLGTLPFVAYAIFRYQHLSERSRRDAPEEILLRDPGMAISVLLWGGTSLTILLVMT